MELMFNRKLHIAISVITIFAITSSIVSVNAATHRTIDEWFGPFSQQTAVTFFVGNYSGQATLQGVYNGTLDNTTAVSSTMDLGYIDLAFNVAQSGNTVNGSVILSRTLVYSATDGTIAVTGSMNGNKLHLQSGQFKMKMNEARMINGEQIAPERIVTRQFSLDTEQILNDGATLLGIYRETIWGYAPEPVTVVGKFALERPVFGANSASGQRRVYMPLIRK